jgi:alpha-N-arabinofuranosidase
MPTSGLISKLAVSLLVTSFLPVAAQESAEVSVDLARPLHAVDRRIFGHHVEHFGRVIQGGLWAELLRNRKFYPIDADRAQVAEPWKAETDRSDVSYVIDRSETLDGISSQRVSVFGGGNRWRGISQSGFDVLDGREYVAYAWIRAQPSSGNVSFRLESSDGQVAAHSEATLTEGDFRRYEVRLRPDRDLRPAVFRIAFNSPGAQWIGAASLMPADAMDGIRRDVYELVARLKPTIFRWPGGGYTDSYDWRKAIGPRDRRPPQDLLPFGQPLGYDHGMDPNDFGTDEFLRLCERLGAEPYISANFGSGTPEMAAAWVEYCNGPANSPWGRRRAENGHPKPYGVRSWSVGNEIWGPFEPGYTNADGYLAFFLPIARAMRRVDPSIAITAVGHFDQADRTEWNEPLLKNAWREIDLLSMHHYYPTATPSAALLSDPLALYKAIVAEPDQAERGLREVIAMTDRIAGEGKKIQIPLDEWNEWDWSFPVPQDRPERSLVNQFIDLINLSGLEFNHTARDAIFGARMLQMLMRLSDRVPIAIRTHLINSLGAIRTDSTRAYMTASGETMELYGQHSGTLLLKLDRRAPTFDVPQTGWKDISLLDAVATYDPSTRTVFLHLINLSASAILRTGVSLAGGTPQADGTIWQIAPADFLSRNDFGVTNVEIQKTAARGISNRFPVDLPAHSITTLEIRMKE